MLSVPLDLNVSRHFNHVPPFSFLDWVLLDAKFSFLFTDPLLTRHLKEQADLLIGRNFLDLIHPDEQENASRDLQAVVQHQAIHGSVTRYVL